MSTSGDTTLSQPDARRPAGGFLDYPWRRLLLSVLFFALMWLSLWALAFIAIAQFVLRIFDADAGVDLRGHGARLGRYIAQMAAYVVFAREDAPFPFARFPRADAP